MEQLLGLRADIETHLVGRNGIRLHDFRSNRSVTGRESGVDDDIRRQNELNTGLLSGLDISLDGFQLIFFQQRGTHLVALGLEEGVHHAAADNQAVGAAEKILDHAKLVRHLGAAEHDGQRTLRVLSSAGQCLDFLLNEQAGGRRQELRDRIVGSLRAVHNTEAVGNEDIAEFGDLLGIGVTLSLVLAGFFRVEAHILEQNNIAVVHSRDLGMGISAIRILSKRDVHTEQFTQTLGDRRQRQLGNDLTLRTAEMSHQNNLRTVSAQSLDSRQSGANTAVIGDGGAIQRNIEICANQYALALEISKILQCLHEYPFLTACHTSHAGRW